MKKDSNRGRRSRPSATTKTIADFGAQWTRYTENDGYYASVRLLADICGPLLELDSLDGARVADVGSGTGRIVNMLLQAGATCVIAVEPSAAFEALQRNTAADAAKIEYIHGRGEQLPARRELDYVFSFGVLHHIPDPSPVVRACYNTLRPGGRLVVWLYGKEGNETYLFFVRPVRVITSRMPAPVLAALSHVLNLLLDGYIVACKFLPLPLRSYINNHLSKLSRRNRFLTIYDQLNPQWAKYYTRQEAIDLLTEEGFEDIRLYHRHGYSWTVIGTRSGA